MKRTVLLLEILFATHVAAGSAAAQGKDYFPPAPAPITAASNGWFPGETTHTSVNVLGQIVSRIGRTPEGYEYSIYGDGSGRVEVAQGRSWGISCKIDAMDDARKCSVASYGDAAIFLYFGDGDSPASVCVLSHDFPRRRAAIRVDKNQPVQTDESGCAGRTVVDQLISGKEVVTRGYKWPRDYPVDQRGSLNGLSRAVDLVRYIRKNLVGMPSSNQ